MRVPANDVARRMAAFKAAAASAGIKLTHQRLEIFREVASSLEHPDAEAVFHAVRVRMPTVSLDTVYRTLWTLAELGVIAALGPRRESVRFDANLAHHHHYVCMRCGLTRDFVSEQLEALNLPTSVNQLGTIVTTRVEARGICSRCAQLVQARSRSQRKQARPTSKRRTP